MNGTRLSASPPWLRSLSWVGAACLLFLGIVLRFGVRPDLAEFFGQGANDLEWVACTATGLAATLAAFEVSLPDRSRWWALLPLPALALWLAMQGHACLLDWLAEGERGLAMGDSDRCFVVIVSCSVPLWLLLGAMVRHGALIRPRLTAALSGLAVAALAASGLDFFHTVDATLMDVVIHTIAVAVVVLVATSLGSPLLRRLASP